MQLFSLSASSAIFFARASETFVKPRSVLESGRACCHKTRRPYQPQAQLQLHTHARAKIAIKNPNKSRVTSQTKRPMSKGTQPDSRVWAPSEDKGKNKKWPVPLPSSSVLLLSPTNQVLLLHRVKTSTAFASAHVFPGGNVSDFHDGILPPAIEAARHLDSPVYRLCAIRETFEESGILLARRQGSKDGPLLNLPTSERDAARRGIWEYNFKFGDWLEKIGGIADTGKWRTRNFTFFPSFALSIY
jgi:8-oxo-dGTP pyrophosphatase MutT (NUDIX family)